MAIVYLSDSSRRKTDTPREVMEEKWDKVFGKKPKGAVCSWCYKKSFDAKVINGLCSDCREVKIVS
jgi:hypothetical protein